MNDVVLINKTEVAGRGMVTDIGVVLPPGIQAPRFTPVRFEDGTHAVLVESGRPLLWKGLGSRTLNRAIRDSTRMPEVQCLGSGILYILVWDGERQGRIRHHYGFGKEDREDCIEWV